MFATKPIYVTNAFQKIHVINGAINTELQSTQLPSKPNGIAVNEKANTLYVTLLDRNVNAIVNAIAVVMIVGETSEQPKLRSKLFRYVANLGGGIPPSVMVINLTTRAVTTVKTISGARVIAVPNLNQVYIGTDDGMQIMDGATNTILSTTPKKSP